MGLAVHPKVTGSGQSRVGDAAAVGTGAALRSSAGHILGVCWRGSEGLGLGGGHGDTIARARPMLFVPTEHAVHCPAGGGSSDTVNSMDAFKGRGPRVI